MTQFRVLSGSPGDVATSAVGTTEDIPTAPGVRPLTDAVPWFANTVPFVLLNGSINDSASDGATVFAVNTLAYSPFRLVSPGRIVLLSAWQIAAAAAGGVFRMGIYETTGGAPGQLVFSSGQIATDGANGWKSAACSVALSAGTIYWIVSHFGVNAPTFSAPQLSATASAMTALGHSPTADPTQSPITVSVAAAYGSLAQTAVTPTAASFVFPLGVYARFSA